MTERNGLAPPFLEQRRFLRYLRIFIFTDDRCECKQGERLKNSLENLEGFFPGDGWLEALTKKDRPDGGAGETINLIDSHL